MEIYFSTFEIFLSHPQLSSTSATDDSISGANCPLELLNNIVYLFNYAGLHVRRNTKGLLLSSELSSPSLIKEKDNKTTPTSASTESNTMEMTWGITKGSTSS